MGDRFDRLMLLGLTLTLGFLALLLLQAPARHDGALRPALARALERDMALQARLALLGRIYGPVEELAAAGAPEQALLKLEELNRQYPGEAHGQILKGEILRRLGALPEAAASFARGVRLDGDYLEERSPLTRRTEIRQLVEEGLATVGERARAHPDNPTFSAQLRELYYLQSRLAGGCE